MSRRRVVALVGLSGVGKSTLLDDARQRLVFEHLQVSDFIKAERQERQGKPVAHDLLREGNIDDNQALLTSGFTSEIKSALKMRKCSELRWRFTRTQLRK